MFVELPGSQSINFDLEDGICKAYSTRYVRGKTRGKTLRRPAKLEYCLTTALNERKFESIQIVGRDYSDQFSFNFHDVFRTQGTRDINDPGNDGIRYIDGSDRLIVYPSESNVSGRAVKNCEGKCDNSTQVYNDPGSGGDGECKSKKPEYTMCASDSECSTGLNCMKQITICGPDGCSAKEAAESGPAGKIAAAGGVMTFVPLAGDIAAAGTEVVAGAVGTVQGAQGWNKPMKFGANGTYGICASNALCANRAPQDFFNHVAQVNVRSVDPVARENFGDTQGIFGSMKPVNPGDIGTTDVGIRAGGLTNDSFSDYHSIKSCP